MELSDHESQSHSAATFQSGFHEIWSTPEEAKDILGILSKSSGHKFRPYEGIVSLGQGKATNFGNKQILV